MTRIPVSPPRWLDLTRWLLLSALCLAPQPLFIRRLLTNTLPSNAGLLEVVFGLLGLFLLYWTVRRALHAWKAGPGIVELSNAAPRIGDAIDYRVVAGNANTQLEATLICTSARFRRRTDLLVSLPLAAPVAESGRWKSEGTLTLPSSAVPTSASGDIPRIEWRIDVALKFPAGYLLKESHVFRVR